MQTRCMLSSNDKVLIKVLRQEKLSHDLTIAKRLYLLCQTNAQQTTVRPESLLRSRTTLLDVVNGVCSDFDVWFYLSDIFKPAVMINGAYYCHVLPAIRESTGETVVYVSARQTGQCPTFCCIGNVRYLVAVLKLL